ncbi:RtcB family protein [Jeotgalibaca sp. MA1X17-3]|uniref:RtcB family protein n=1 Tax=Jeotgalibaca sp. MA1X17-3 TaxID=2908211 RepID=UPI001F1B0D9E|nr:RtcB family protein [Jeotgalibaca sp. MA1X17-3]UJF15613.1 RtcB family protein [Jeotgalibaca sp. MA1X17-3]
MDVQDELKLTGTFADATVFTTNINQETIDQITRLLNHPFSEGIKIRIMPDTHIGKGAVVGTTMTYHDKMVPDVVGVDIGCGMYLAKLSKTKWNESDFKRLDQVINDKIPSGSGIRKKSHPLLKEINLDDVRAPIRRKNRSALAIGSLGGGNHFIELDKDEEENHYFVIHSGSRALGHDVASYYQKKAVQQWKERGNENEEGHFVDSEFAYLEEEDMEDYLHDVQICQRFAHLNRKAMMEEIIQKMKVEIISTFDTIHNYVDVPNQIIRKGAISAHEGEEILIPINMRDGSILAVGKGNPDWNNSAPHGAGRLLSRTQAKKNYG